MIEFDHALRLVPIIFVGIALVIGLPLAILIALALIRLFRRRVGRAMRSAAAGAVDTATGQAARPSPSTLPREELEIEWMRTDGKIARTGSTSDVLADARRQANRLAAIYAGAACLFPFVLAGVMITYGHFAKNEFFVYATVYGAFVLMHASPAVLAPTMIMKKQPRYLLLAVLMLVVLYGTFDVSVQQGAHWVASMLAFIPMAMLLIPIVLWYSPNVLPIAAFAFVSVLWLTIAGGQIHYDFSGLMKLWLFWVPVPLAIVLLLNIRRLRAVGPIMYAVIAIFLLAHVFSTWVVTEIEIASGEPHLFMRQDLNQLSPMGALSRLFDERVFSLPEEEQSHATMLLLQDLTNDFVNKTAIIFHPDATLRNNMPSFVLVLLGKTICGFVLAWLFIRWLAKSYVKRRASDQMLSIDVVMVIFVLLNFLLVAFLYDSYIAGVCVLASFPAYKLCSRWGLAWLRRSVPDASPRTLLLLRVFGFDSRTQWLLEDLGQRWRYLGPIRLIGGTDLANATIEPHEFFEFLNGRLSRAFVKGPTDVDKKLSRSAITADPDGTYRVEDFFCHDDTWRMTIVRLARDADAILMDLRGFGPANQGCVYEIEQLLSSVPLDRVVLLVDRRTDVPFLERALQQAWRSRPDDSPNALARHQRIRIMAASSRHRRTLNALLYLLCGSFVETPPSRSPAPILQAQPLPPHG